MFPSNVSASDRASEQLARRLQEEEDQLTAYLLHAQFNDRTPITLDTRTHVFDVSPGPSANNVPFYVTSDEEGRDDDDVEELSFVQLSDDDIVDNRDVPMSPDTNVIVTNALNTAFSTPNATRTNTRSQGSDEIVILDDSVIEDDRPSRSNRSRAVSEDSDNIVLTVGRSARSAAPAAQLTTTDTSSIVITNNSQAPSANTRSRTRNNRGRGRGRPAPETSQVRGRGRTRTLNQIVNNLGSSGSEAVDITDNNRPGHNQQSGVRTRTGSGSRSNSRQPNRNIPSITNRTPTHNSDNQPSTSSGRRANNHRHRTDNFRSRANNPGNHQVSTRVILNGIPLRNTAMMRQQGIALHHELLGYVGVNTGVNIMFGGGSDNMTYEQMIALDDGTSLEPGQGLSKHDISQYTISQSYKKSDQSDNDKGSSSCNICLCDLEEGDKIRTLPCFHSFHAPCIDNWLSRKAECPVCRSPVQPQPMDVG